MSRTLNFFTWEDAEDEVERLEHKLERAEAKLARAEDALREIAGWNYDPPYPDWQFAGLAEDRERAMQQVARDALAMLPFAPSIETQRKLKREAANE